MLGIGNVIAGNWFLAAESAFGHLCFVTDLKYDRLCILYQIDENKQWTPLSGMNLLLP